MNVDNEAVPLLKFLLLSFHSLAALGGGQGAEVRVAITLQTDSTTAMLAALYCRPAQRMRGNDRREDRVCTKDAVLVVRNEMTAVVTW